MILLDWWGDEASTLFWKDSWLDGVSFDVRYARLFDPVVNKLSTIAKMFFWGGHRKVRHVRLFAWGKRLVKECMEQQSLVVL